MKVSYKVCETEYFNHNLQSSLQKVYTNDNFNCMENVFWGCCSFMKNYQQT